MNETTLTLKIERAISELRRGGNIVVSDAKSGTSVLLIAAELIEKNTINKFSDLTLSRPNIVLSNNRGKAVGLEFTNEPCSILIDKYWTIDDILSICMPLTGHKIPFINGVIAESNKSVASYCLLILRQARLLPAGLMSIISNVVPENIGQWTFDNDLINVDITDIKFYEQNNAENLVMAVRAKVPIAETDNCEIVIFRPQDGGDEHFCLIFGKTRLMSDKCNEETLVRIHSQCITGDILDSLKCDCGEQLKQSIKIMAQADEGVLIYLAQEGRDIGLLNKLRAYSLQETGMDTVEANEDLGFNDDERLYYPAKQILSLLKIGKIKLITNNPKKIDHLRKLGVNVSQRIPIKINPNKYNRKYLETKSKKSGHIL